MTRKEALSKTTNDMYVHEIDVLIEGIYDDFESQVCNNCLWLEAFDYCDVFNHCIKEPDSFGCNKFKPGEQ